MNQLLKGLLAPTPEERLSAKKALRLPVFDKFRGSQLPERSSPSKQGSANFGDDDTDVFDEGSPVMASIMSLEGRSIVLRKPMDPATYAGSVSLSVRWEGESQTRDKSPDFNKKPIPRRLASGIQGESPNKLSLPRQESFDTESKISADDRLSPLGSPKGRKPILLPVSKPSFLSPQMQPRQISLFGGKKSMSQYGPDEKDQ